MFGVGKFFFVVVFCRIFMNFGYDVVFFKS